MLVRRTCTGCSRKIYPSKNSNKNNTRLRMKKCFYKIFQKYSLNIMNSLNFKTAAFCFDDESLTLFHWSAITSHHFSVQLGPSWLNNCPHGVQIGVVTSWNILLQNRPATKVHGINIRVWGCPYFLVSQTSWFGSAPPHWQPKTEAEASSFLNIYFVLESFCVLRNFLRNMFK